MSAKTKLAIFLIAAIVIGIALQLVSSQGLGESLPPVFDHDLDNHPLYQNYAFGEDARVLDIGTQPLLFPTGLITEVLKRDSIYTESLQEIDIEVRFHPFLKGRDVNHFLEKGKLDAGIGGDAPTLSAIAKLNAMAPVVVQRGFLSIVSDRPMLVEGLKGKRIGYARGSNAHYALLAALEHRDLSVDDVTLIPMDITQMTFALEHEIIDAFSAWEPEPAEALNAHPEFVTIHERIGTGFMYFSNTTEMENHDSILLTVAAVIRAISWLRDSNENIYQAADWLNLTSAEMLGKPSTLTNQQIALLAENDLIGLFSLPELPASDLEQNGTLQHEYDFLVDLGSIPSGVPWEQVREKFRTDIMDEILASRDSFRLEEFDYNLH